MSPTERLLRDWRRRGERLARMNSPFSVLTRGRHSYQGVDASQLFIRDEAQLRILAAGNGASAGDIGKFWFIPGFSAVGGGDIIPDEPL